MTIALGVLARDGFVLAADTQETYAGMLKVDQPKIMAATAGTPLQNSGVIAVSGAGNAGYVDALTQDVCQWFLEKKPRDLEQARLGLKSVIAAFDAEHVRPYATLPEYERPGVSMLVAAHMGKGRGSFWVSDKSTLHEHVPFAAVGIGAPHANLLLGRLWQECDLVTAARLAAYVLFCVKRQVDGCGSKTEMLFVNKKGEAYTYSSRLLLDLEREYSQFMEIEERSIRYVLGFKTKSSRSELAELHHYQKIFRKKVTAIKWMRKEGLGTTELGTRDTHIRRWVDDTGRGMSRRKTR